MPRWATRAPVSATLALAAAGACARPARPPPPPAGPELRVGLVVRTAGVWLGGRDGGELFVTDAAGGGVIAAIPAGQRWTIVPDSADRGRLRLVRPDGSRTAAHRGLVAVNVTEGRFAVANGHRYRGRLQAWADGIGITLVNRVGLEEYLAGVIGHEIGARRPDEFAAVLAQAVVSRTFALRNRGRWESLGFDAFADTRDQVYLGVAAETPQAWAALQRTRGMVLRHGGRLIDAFYHSTCGASTAAVTEVFTGARPVPYLRAVSDARRGGYYCDASPRFRWREEWDGEKLRAILTRTLTAVMPLGDSGLSSISGVTVTRTTPSGRVGELRITFSRGDVRIPGHQIRTILRPDAGRILHSAAFQLIVDAGGGEVRRLIAAGGGSGHGVGMCQWGAIGRARAGQDHRTILTTYFPGTKIERVY